MSCASRLIPRFSPRLNLEPRRYVLAVGSRTPNKNLNGVLKASELLTDLGYRFVAAGGSNSRVFNGVTLKDDSLVLTRLRDGRRAACSL